MCNVIPHTSADFRGALGATSRPFAGPGDFVSLAVRTQVCDFESPGFLDLPGGATLEDDYAVTLLFEPPNGVSNAHVLATDCTALAAEIAACGAAPELAGGSVTCTELTAGADLTVTQSAVDYRARFRFPQTAFAGPVTIAITDVGSPLPCGLADRTVRCADSLALPGLTACIDEFFVIDGTCRTTPDFVDTTFGSFTALPPPNDYQAMCTTPNTACDDKSQGAVQFTVDVDGNALVPIDWRGVMAEFNGQPIARLTNGDTSIESTTGGGAPISLPNGDFIGSFSPEGVRLPPIFAPLTDPLDPDLKLFGTVDAPLGVIRVTRRSPSFQECRDDGTQNPLTPGVACTGDGDCPGGSHCGDAYCRDGGAVAAPLTECTDDATCSAFTECGPALFEFRNRFSAAQTGPVVISAGFYNAAIETLVALDGLVDTSDVFAFAVNESVDGVDLNNDSDTNDFVTTIRDGTTGAIQATGVPSADGRPVVRIRENPFRYAALVGEDDVVAYLEPEPGQALAGDVTGDFDVADTVLRVYREDPMNPGQIEEVTTGSVCADAAPNIAGRSLALSDGLVFFRQAEDACARHVTEYASLTDTDVQSVGSLKLLTGISADGELVAFQGYLPDVIIGTSTNALNTFVRDTAAPPPPPPATEWVSFGSVGGPPPQEPDSDQFLFSQMSADGRFVAFRTPASNIVAGAAGHWTYLHDRMTATTTELDLSSTGVVPDDVTNSLLYGMSRDGQLVLFSSLAKNLLPAGQSVAACTSGEFCTHVFLHDRGVGITEQIDVNDGGAGSNGRSPAAAMSPDGRFVAFLSYGDNLLGTPAPSPQLYLRDRQQGTTELISVAVGGGFGTNVAGSGFEPLAVSDTGFVVFATAAPDLVPGDTNLGIDVFVRDRERGITERVSVASDGSEGSSASSSHIVLSVDIGTDGRYVAFSSRHPNLVDGDTNAAPDSFLRDRIAGITQLVSISGAGTQGTASCDSNAESSRLSADGRTAVFGSCNELVSPDSSTTYPDIFVRRPDPADPLNQDFTGDGDHADTILRVLDARATTPAPASIGPATTADVAAGNAVFLRPEAETGEDLNGVGGAGDGDTDDEVVFLYHNRQMEPIDPTNLEKAATAVAISAGYLAAVLDEAGEEGRVGVHAVPAPSVDWTVLPDTADTVDVNAGFVAFITPETVDLNADGDTADRIIGLYDAAGAQSIAILDGGGQRVPVLDFVLGDELLAMSTREGDLCGVPVDDGNCAAPPGCLTCDLNGDGDCCDDVVQTFDLVSETFASSGKAMLPCELSACDPRTPYRVTSDTVRFLTFEPDQSADLNDDGDENDLLVHLLNARAGSVTVVGEVALPPGASPGDPDVIVSNPIGAPDLGGTGGEGTVDVLQSSGLCFEPPGATACTGDADCASGELCDAIAGFCVRTHGTCESSADCPEVASCSEDRLIVVATADTDGDQVPDPLDNCPEAANVDQTDIDTDGVGDVCDIRICGNAQRELAEECDGPDPGPPSACDAGCCFVAGACDVDMNMTIESADVLAVLAAEGAPAVGLCDAYDPDRDGSITTADTHLCEAACPFPTCCGNGIFAGLETCDDGGTAPGDGCNAICQIDPGWACVGEPSLCNEICGDTLIVGTEECDDGGQVPGDGCSAICTVEDSVPLYGVTQGGNVSVTVDGVLIAVATSPFQTASELATALALAIEADPTLSAQGVTATVAGEFLVTDGSISAFGSTDPGIALGVSSEPPLGPLMPVGAIVAWHRDLAGTPALPAGWLEANGQVVNDPQSPLDGQTLPDLNGERRFLRGNATSGVFELDQFQGHWHAVSHDLWEIIFDTTTYSAVDFVDDTAASIDVTNPSNDGMNGDPRTDAETRPINASVIWIIKVKGASVPVGSIVAWHQDLLGTPALPDGWVPVSGQTLNDAQSVYDGELLPDLNGERRFLRGDASSGVLDDDAFQGHHHSFSYTGERIAGGPGWGHTPGQPQFAGVVLASIAVLHPITDNENGDPVRTADETRPLNMSVVWLLKTKAAAGNPPLGSIVAWHAALPGETALTPGVLIADGQVVSDAQSPLDGQTLPDLNGEARFLRGGTTSGIPEPDAIQGHYHDVSSDANRLTGGSPLTSDPFSRQAVDIPGSFSVSDPVTDNSNGDPRTGNETRPVNMSVVWVMSVSPAPLVPALSPTALALVVSIVLASGAFAASRSRDRRTGF